MVTRIVSLAIEQETDIILARDRTRRIADRLGFDAQDRTRIATAVSEIVRNALEYGGKGRVEYRIDTDATPQLLEILVSDEGPGMANVAEVLSGAHRSATGMGVGILGARRLMDAFEIETAPGRGTRVRMAKNLPRRERRLEPRDAVVAAKELATHRSVDPLAEIRHQNQELIVQLDALSARQDELRQLNKELEDTNRGVVALYAELDERADHLRRADELKTRFLSNMSHEFRTPLNSILALSRLLLSGADGPLSPEQEKQAQFIRKAAEMLSELVNDLLDLAKVEAGKTVVTPTEFRVDELFSALRGMLRPLLAGESVALVFDDASGLPAMVTDEGKISQILRNFISNALKFTEKGEVRLWADYDPAADSVTFKVRDTGIGIAPEHLDLIWQEFAQLEGGMKSHVKGTGLGLPLSRRLAELLCGSVAVDSEPGHGSIFSLTVPRAWPLGVVAAQEAAEWAPIQGKVPVLVLEDNEADRFAYERLLAPTRYQPCVVTTVADATRALPNVKPAAVVLDILLATEESWRLLVDLRHRDGADRLPVLVVSTSGQEAKALHLGADAYLGKPLDSRVLVGALDRLTGAREATRVLVIDDDEVFRYLIRQLLPRGSFVLREAATVADGLDALAAERPDVVLLDLNLPVMDGFGFLDRLQEEAPPVVVVTSRALDGPLRTRLARAATIVAKSDLNAYGLVTAIQQAVAPSASAAS